MRKHFVKHARAQVRLAAKIVGKEPSLENSFQWAGPHAERRDFDKEAFFVPTSSQTRVEQNVEVKKGSLRSLKHVSTYM